MLTNNNKNYLRLINKTVKLSCKDIIFACNYTYYYLPIQFFIVDRQVDCLKCKEMSILLSYYWASSPNILLLHFWISWSSHSLVPFRPIIIVSTTVKLWTPNLNILFIMMPTVQMSPIRLKKVRKLVQGQKNFLASKLYATYIINLLFLHTPAQNELFFILFLKNLFLLKL